MRTFGNISEMVRTPSSDKSGMKKGAWTPEEDEKLIAYVTRYGCWNWRQLPRFAGLARCGKSCRLRWLNYLRPDIKRGHYTKEEEDIIVRLHYKLGSRWSVIAANLPGRTDNDIKNHWNSNLKKRFQRKSKVTHEKVEDTTKPNVSGSKQDTESEQNNAGFFQVVTPQTKPSSPQLSSAEFSSNENLVADDFGFMDAFTQQPMNEDIWSESFLAELMPDNGDSTFQGSDTAMQIPDSRASSPQSSNSEGLVVENEHLGFVESTQPAVENSCIAMGVADVSHVPNALFAPFVREYDEYFCPMYYDDVDLWNQSNLHDVHVGLF